MQKQNLHDPFDEMRRETGVEKLISIGALGIFETEVQAQQAGWGVYHLQKMVL